MTAEFGFEAAPPPALTGDLEVLRALVRRGDSGLRDDGHRIALVINGGGMRGAYAGGMVHALEDAGLGMTFDVIYGSSAGAFVGAGLLLGQGRGSAHIFFEDMASRAFIDPRRMGRKNPMVSLDHLLDHVLVRSKPLDWERLRDSPIPLRVLATAADDLTPHILEPRTVAEWKSTMRATSTIPLLAGPPVEMHGRRWIDGSVSDPLPVGRALTEGATHVLALVNRTAADLRRADSTVDSARWVGQLNRIAPGLGAMAHEDRRLRPAVAVLKNAAKYSRQGIHLFAVLPAVDARITGLTTDPVRVRQATQSGYAAMNSALDRVSS